MDTLNVKGTAVCRTVLIAYSNLIKKSNQFLLVLYFLVCDSWESNEAVISNKNFPPLLHSPAFVSDYLHRKLNCTIHTQWY